MLYRSSYDPPAEAQTRSQYAASASLTGFHFANVSDLRNDAVHQSMRSQKQTNKSPRPFKSGQSDRGWGSGNRDAGFIPGGKPVFKAKKTAATPPPTSDPSPAATEPAETATEAPPPNQV